MLDINVEHELLSLDLLPVTEPIMFGVCYRPKDFYVFFVVVVVVVLTRFFNNYNALTKECICMGDFNNDIRSTYELNGMTYLNS